MGTAPTVKRVQGYEIGMTSVNATKRIGCLANTRKLSGRCIAGRELVAECIAGPWIRPVSERHAQEVSEYERQYEDGSDPRMLDIIDTPTKEPKPEGWQTENWISDSKHYWSKVGRYSQCGLSSLVDLIVPLWCDENSTYSGENDRSEAYKPIQYPTSLRLIRVADLEL